MTLTFAETHNMIAYLTKSDASEGFNQIIDFLNGSSIRLQAIVEKKKMVITKASIRDALRLDDAEGVKCLPNEEIFAELARMGYEKPSTKLTFYKAFFSSQWKFLIHTILQCMSAKRTSWNEFSSSMASAVICLSLGFSGVETPPIEGMIVEQKVAEVADEVHDEGVPAVGIVAEGDVSAANDEVPTIVEEPYIPSPTPPTPPPQPSQDIPSTSQDAEIFMDLLQNLMDTCTTLSRRVEHLEQDKVAQALEITKLKPRVKKLKRRNKASKLKRLKKVGTTQRIDTLDDTVMDDVSKQREIIANIDADEDVVLEDAKDDAVEKFADVDEANDDIHGRKADSQAEIYKIDLEHAKKVLSMQEEESELAELQKVVDVVTTTKIITEVVTAGSTTITVADVPILAAAPTLTDALSRKRKGVVIRDPQETTTPSTIIHSEAKSKDKGKGILVEEPKPLKKQAQIKQDEQYARELKAKLNKTIDWDEVIDHVQRKQKEDKSNVAGFKMDYFNGMSYDDIRPIFEKYFDSNVAFLKKTKEQMDEEDRRALKRLNESQEEKAAKKQKLEEKVEELKRHLQIVPNDDDDVYTEATPLALKVPVVDYEIYNQNSKPYYKIKRADGSYQLYLSFLSLLRNFDREDLEALWRLVKERFTTTKPKNFFDDFMLITLRAMFEKPDIHAQI
uniref:Synaptobrevin, longin-like domain protein n=1 Tax=Tanacetum cinerariifolium TaxID=118510 RepID=A0A699HK95_TANCI|nr:hypothetical protein [Tanacetum cinerariifolium]